MAGEKYALVLTGDLLSGFNADTTWPKIAAQFKMDMDRLHSEALQRAPLTIKESEDLAGLKSMMSTLKNIGADVEIHPLEADGNLFVLIDNKPRGPMPLAFIRQRVRRKTWPASIRVAPVGSNDWRTLEPESQTSVLHVAGTPESAPSLENADTVAAKIARVAGSVANRLDRVQTLPPGNAIHAGFWRRCAAYILDSLILFIPSFIVGLVPLLGMLVALIGRWLYFALMESSAGQGTLGKRAMGIRVTDGKGQRIGFGQATGRYFGAALSYIILYIGYFMAGFTARKQALHDMMADTCVVFDSVQPGQELPTVRPPMPWYGWLLNGLSFILPLAIIAAVALPAYQQYVARSQVMTATAEVWSLKSDVAESVINGSGCPEGTRPSSSPLVESIRLGGSAPDCTIELRFATTSEVPSLLRGQSIEWQVHGADTGIAVWTCASSIDASYLPADCRP